MYWKIVVFLVFSMIENQYIYIQKNEEDKIQRKQAIHLQAYKDKKIEKKRKRRNIEEYRRSSKEY